MTNSRAEPAEGGAASLDRMENNRVTDADKKTSFSLLAAGANSDQPPLRCEPLAGKAVAFTGRLAALSRSEVHQLVRAHGGRACSTMTRQVGFLVVGQGGWPLRKDGRLTRKLRRAQQLQQQGVPLQIINEDAFFERLGLFELRQEVCRRYTAAQLTQILGLPAERVRYWIETGVLEAAETVQGVALFDFSQVATARSLWELSELGISPARLRRSLEQLSAWFPDMAQCLSRLNSVEGRVLLRSEDGAWLEPTGQHLLDFDADQPPPEPAPSVAFARDTDWDELFDRAFQYEQQGDYEQAEAVYRQLLRRTGSDAEVCFNLANVLMAQGRTEAATERFWQALELDADYLEAWNNLGAALAQQGRPQQALEALQEALARDPEYGDALYNLADTLDEMGRLAEARCYWRGYLAYDADSPWADYARLRLSETAGPDASG